MKKLIFILIPFKKSMKKFFILSLLLVSNSVFAQLNIGVNCTNNQCNSPELSNAYNGCFAIINKTQCESKVIGNLCQWIDDNNPNGGFCTSIPQQKICSGYNCPVGESMSVIKMRGFLNLDLSVLTDQVGTPQNLGISLSNGEFPGKNANISIASQNENAKGANLILVGDNFNNLNINLDGYNGKNGKNTSEICADKIKNGDYGVSLQTYFNNRRASTSADPNRCDADDLNYIQSFSFTCDDPSYQEISANNPVVQVNQIKKMARCNSVASYNYCVKKKVNVNCSFKLWSPFRQSWLLNGTNYDIPSYYNGAQTCSNQYTSCGYAHGSCDGSGNVTNVIFESSSSGSTFNNQCIYKFDGTSLCQVGSNTFSSTESFYKTSICVGDKVSGMPVSRSTSVGPFDEDFFNSETNRLGGIDKFCDSYGQIPSKSNADWWAGVPGAPAQSFQTINSTSVETNGIPWELMAEISVGSSSLSAAPPEPSGAISNWKNETQSVGGYSPITSRYLYNTVLNGCTNLGGGFGTICSYNYIYRWKTKGAYWKGNGSSFSFSSPGLNPDGISLAPGSLWEVTQTNTFENCPQGWNTLKNVFLNLVQYTNKENTSCSGISDPLDPNNRAFWQYTGIAQEPTFGTEFVSCGIGSCAVNSTVSELSRSLDTITSGSGENGTEQGRGLLFVYDIKNLVERSLPGSSGQVGAADLNINSQIKVCAKIDDANAGINTEQAKNPFVSFRRYNWQGIKSVVGGNPGASPQNTGKSVEVYKKLDPGTRYFLDKTLL